MLKWIKWIHLRIVFRYDIDNSGAIDKKEMVGVMKAIYAMVDGNISGAVRGGTEEKASKHAKELFILIDTDGDGVVDDIDLDDEKGRNVSLLVIPQFF